jgi:RNA polymerase sigma-70 factor (ECF subfamily)
LISAGGAVYVDMNAEECFNTLVRSHSYELYRYALGLWADPYAAEDLLRELCLRAWRRLDRLRDPNALRGRLYTILKKDFARAYRTVPSRSLGALDEEALAAQCGRDTGIEALRLRAAIRTLPLGYREPLLLQVIGGFSCQEIADMLGLTLNAVMARVSRARRRLRGSLGQDGAASPTRRYVR